MITALQAGIDSELVWHLGVGGGYFDIPNGSEGYLAYWFTLAKHSSSPDLPGYLLRL